jgi:hypothetical protein
VKDIEIYIKILEKRYPKHHFEMNVGGNSLFVYGEEDDKLYSFCQNLSECMCKPIHRIAFIKTPSELE